jgi:hypothetical protein
VDDGLPTAQCNSLRPDDFPARGVPMKMSKYTTCLYQVAAWTLIVEITFLQPVQAASDCQRQ